MPARGMRHAQFACDDATVRDGHQAAAARFGLAPPVTGVGVTKCGRVARLAVDERDAIEMTAVFSGKRADERRSPARDEAVVWAERAQAREARVDEPQLVRILTSPADFVDADVAGDVAGARD